MVQVGITAVLILFLTNNGTASAAPSFEMGITVAQLNDLNRLVIAAKANLERIIAHSKSGDSPSMAKSRTELEAARLARKRAGTTFADAMASALKASPQSVQLLVVYARAFNELIDAQKSLTTLAIALNANRTAVKLAQSTLNSAVSGGQSDMNRELGAMRKRLSQATELVTRDQDLLKIANSEVSIAQIQLANAEAANAGDLLVSLAIRAERNVKQKGATLRKLPLEPRHWSWG